MWIALQSASFLLNMALLLQRCVTVLLHSTFHHVSVISIMASLFADVYDFLSFSNVLLVFLLLLLFHYLTVLYEFRNMPPGPRLTAVPILGNALSLDFKAEKLTDAFRRLVISISTQGIVQV